MDPYSLIEKYYKDNPKAKRVLINHVEAVANKAKIIAKRAGANINFVWESAMLHDIGVIYTDAPDIFCFGSKPYLAHGYIGRKLLEKEGHPKHALVAERHTGVGITKDEILKNNLPLPKRDMVPVSKEQEIVCFADCFFSKTPGQPEKSVSKIKQELSKFGRAKVRTFELWLKKYG